MELNLAKVKSLDVWLAFIAIAGLIVLVLNLICQNFIISESFELLGLREIDDLAFQHTLRKIHTFLFNGQILDLFSVVDYGYGNLFWTLHALVTIPGYLLSSPQITIVTARLTSVFLFSGAFYNLYRIYRILIPEEKYRSLSLFLILIAACTPAVMLAALRFHTHGLLTFLISFCVYSGLMFLFKKRGSKWMFIFAGLAVGVKMTGLFIAPFVFFICVFKYNFDFFKREVLKRIAKDILYFILCAAFGLSPVVILFFRYGGNVNEIFHTLYSYFLMSKSNVGSPDNANPVFLLKNGFFSYYYSAIIYSIFSAGAVLLLVFSKKEFRTFYASIFFTYLIVFAYLLFKTAQGPLLISWYFLPLGILLPIGFLGYLHFNLVKNNIQLTTICFILMFIMLTNLGLLNESLFRYEKFVESRSYSSSIESFRTIGKSFDFSKSGLRILKDYRVNIPISAFNSDAYIINFYDNIDIINSDKPFDLVIICKKSVLFEKLTVADHSNWKEMRAAQSVLFKLISEHFFLNALYMKISEDENFIMYQVDKSNTSSI